MRAAEWMKLVRRPDQVARARRMVDSIVRMIPGAAHVRIVCKDGRPVHRVFHPSGAIWVSTTTATPSLWNTLWALATLARNGVAEAEAALRKFAADQNAQGRIMPVLPSHDIEGVEVEQPSERQVRSSEQVRDTLCWHIPRSMRDFEDAEGAQAFQDSLATHEPDAAAVAAMELWQNGVSLGFLISQVKAEAVRSGDSGLWTEFINALAKKFQEREDRRTA